MRSRPRSFVSDPGLRHLVRLSIFVNENWLDDTSAVYQSLRRPDAGIGHTGMDTGWTSSQLLHFPRADEPTPPVPRP